jgi:hypothetical protein
MMPDDIAKLPGSSKIFDLTALAGEFPASAETMLIDMRLTDEPAASARLFRIYTAVPAHYHRTCDEYLLVMTGRARAVVDGKAAQELGTGQLLFSVDTPRRDPTDVTFVDRESGTAESFIHTMEAY